MKTVDYRAVAGAVLLALSTVAHAREGSDPAAGTVSFDIKAPSMVQALIQFTEQSGLQLAFPTDGTVDLPARRVVGSYTPVAALDELLAGSGLHYEFANKRTIAIRGATALSTQGSPDAPADYRLAATTASSDTSKRQGVGINSDRSMEEVVVTGTHLRGVQPSASPVSVYDKQFIERSGSGTIAQFFRTIPQNFGVVGPDTQSNSGNNRQALQNGTFGSSVDLRGIGAGSTLVLMNGRRLAPAGGDGSFIDISMIPLSALDRIEMLTDGASAVYGADAVAGVVNFVLKKDYEGAETSARYADTTRGGANDFTVSQLLGTAWSSGGALLSYELYDQDGLFAAQRDFVPDQGGPYEIVPEQRRHSAYLNVHQALGRLEFSAEGLFSKRNFAQDASFFGLTAHSDGRAEQSGGVLGATYAWADWRSNLSLNWARTEGRTFTTYSDPLFPAGSFYDNQSQASSATLSADGPLFTAPGGSARASIGIEGREEKFSDRTQFLTSVGTDLSRDVRSAFGELFIPLVSPSNAKRWVQRFELSVAARLDDYQDVGSRGSPKVGVHWAPTDAVGLRGTFARSFRAPPLAQLSVGGSFYTVNPLPDPASPSGFTNTLIPSQTNNPGLGPERARSITAGIDFHPEWSGAPVLSLTYFQINYKDRIASPPLVGSLFDLFLQTDVLSPFITRSPSLVDVQRIFDSAPVSDPAGGGPASIEAIFDFRLQNIARTKTNGIDLSATTTLDTAAGKFVMQLGGSYMKHLDFQAAAAADTVNLTNKIFNPMDLRLRTSLGWSAGLLSSSLTASYADGYENNLVSPTGRVSSWTTVDWQLAIRSPEASGLGLFENMSASLSVLNVFDRDPPYVINPNPSANFGYDATNASPLGRAIALSLSKRW